MSNTEFIKSEKLKKVVFAFIMGFITTFIISFALVAINIGFTERFLSVWLKSWMMGYVFVIPSILFIAPIVQQFVDKIIE